MEARQRADSEPTDTTESVAWWKRLGRWLRHGTTKAIDTRAIATAVVLALVLPLWSPIVERLRESVFGSEIPVPNYGNLIGDTYRIQRERRLDLDGQGEDERVVTAVGLPDNSAVPTKVAVLAWDHEAQRWTVVFDSAETPLRTRSWGTQTLIDSGASADHVWIEELRRLRGGGSDLLIAAGHVHAGALGIQAVAIIRFEAEVPFVLFDFLGTGPGDAKVVRTAKRDVVRITSPLQTSIDAHCCPTRNYVFDVAENGRSDYPRYEVIADDRPWTGAYVITDNSAVGVVAAVKPGSPAAKQLRPGDAVLGVVQTPPTAEEEEEEEPRPTFLQDIARKRPGDSVSLLIERSGKTSVVILRLISQMAATADRSRPYLRDLGLELGTYQEGLFVDSVVTDGPARDSNIPEDSAVVAINGMPVDSAAQVALAVLGAPPNEPVYVTFRDPVGNEATSTVVPATRFQFDDEPIATSVRLELL